MDMLYIVIIITAGGGFDSSKLAISRFLYHLSQAASFVVCLCYLLFPKPIHADEQFYLFHLFLYFFLFSSLDTEIPTIT